MSEMPVPPVPAESELGSADFFDRPQFSIEQPEKERLLTAELATLTDHHRLRSREYARICEALDFRGEIVSPAAVPYLPVSLFKTHDLRSVDDDEVFKVMTSSGTTGQAVSRVVLDRRTAALQTRALSLIMREVIGRKRLPMVIVDSPNVIKNRAMFSARGAGLLGMMTFGRDHFYALDDDMRLDVEALQAYVNSKDGSPILFFGFTFMVWRHFLGELASQGVALSVPDGVLIHSGGWKKLVDEAVGNAEFKATAELAIGVTRVHNFYGMVEQVGSVFLEGADGFLYPPNFSDVIIRDPHTWEPVANGVPGVVEVLSVLPRSYPGHALLTEDWGVVHGVGTPESGWCGKQLEIIGRVPRTELRGCSDVHARDLEPSAP